MRGGRTRLARPSLLRRACAHDARNFADTLRASLGQPGVPTRGCCAGVPLIYDVRSKCIRLLDDPVGGEDDPLKRYNFGSNGHLLFQPCHVRYDSENDAEAEEAVTAVPKAQRAAAKS